MSTNQASTGETQSGLLAATIAAVLAAPLFVMVGLAVIFNWGR